MSDSSRHCRPTDQLNQAITIAVICQIEHGIRQETKPGDKRDLRNRLTTSRYY